MNEPTTTEDLYSILSLPRTATPTEIKSAYRRAALLSHPDKLPPTSTPSEIEAANSRFQAVGLAYSVLKDEKRRERYDRTGETEEGTGLRTEAEWKDYFKELWKGEVSSETIEEFKQKYRGSEEEKQDLFTSYTSSQGDLEVILSSIMCSDISDEDRFISLINSAISSNELSSYPNWKKSLKNLTKGKEKRKAKAEKEAGEAEELAKELGVHEKLFGGKGKSTKGKGGGKKGDDDDPEASLRALIQGNQAKRMESMLESIEAKYGAKENNSKKGKGKNSKRGAGVEDDEDEEEGSTKKKKKKFVEPTEEEFAKIQAQVDARRAGKSTTTTAEDAEPKKGKKSTKTKS